MGMFWRDLQLTRPERWSRAFVATGVLWLVCWQALVVLGIGRPATVVAGVYGFVLHVVFGKAYTLLPAYFSRELAISWAPGIQFPITVGATVCLALGTTIDTPYQLTEIGQALWALGVLIFLGAILLTVGKNLSGQETGTSEAQADRRKTDRIANAFIPVVLLYLLLAAIVPILGISGIDVFPAAGIAHLLAVGTAALLIFVVGFRLLPRFLVVHPHRIAPMIVLPAGAIGPGLLAWDFLGVGMFHLGVLLVAIAVVGFAMAYTDMFRRSDRDRIGLQVVLMGTHFGVAAIAVALYLAFFDLDPRLIEAHVRFATLGFLGLVIIGVTYQFYPPNIGGYPGVNDATAMMGARIIGIALLIEVGGSFIGSALTILAGHGLALVGALLYAYIVLSLFWERR